MFENDKRTLIIITYLCTEFPLKWNHNWWNCEKNARLEPFMYLNWM